MRITIESTSKMVTLAADGGVGVPARVWEGTTDGGIPVHCFITRIAPTIERDQLPADVAELFARELGAEQRAPSAEVQVYPLRMLL